MNISDIAPCEHEGGCDTNVGAFFVECPELPVDKTYCALHAPEGAVPLLGPAVEEGDRDGR